MEEDKANKNNNFIGIIILYFKVKIITFLALGANFPKPLVQYVKNQRT